MSISDMDRQEGGDGGQGRPLGRLLSVFPGLTAKQHEVMRFVAENRTSKEIAWELGISESAVNQRIEGVRGRTGSPPRAELARAYRQYLQDLEAVGDGLRRGDAQLTANGAPRRDPVPAHDASGFTENSPLIPVAPRRSEPMGRVVPEVLDGTHAGLSRTAAMIAIAVGILMVTMVGLGVIEALSDIR